MEIVDLPEPIPGPGQKLFDVSTAGVSYADTHHHHLSRQVDQRHSVMADETAKLVRAA